MPSTRMVRSDRADRRRVSRKYLQLAVDLITFCASSLAAIVGSWIAGPITFPVLAVSIVELVAVAVLAWQVVRYADVDAPAR